MKTSVENVSTTSKLVKITSSFVKQFKSRVVWHRPVVLLIAANKYTEKQHLEYLNGELREIRTVLRKAWWGSRFCKIVIIKHPTEKIIEEQINKFYGRIAIVHYSGHSSNEGILVRNEQGDDVKLSMKVFAQILRQKQVVKTSEETEASPTKQSKIKKSNLKLLFLNSCSSDSEYITKLREQLGCYIILTEHKVTDRGAAEVSPPIYKDLSKGKDLSTLEKSFPQKPSPEKPWKMYAPITLEEHSFYNINRDFEEVEEADVEDFQTNEEKDKSLNWNLKRVIWLPPLLLSTILLVMLVGLLIAKGFGAFEQARIENDKDIVVTLYSSECSRKNFKILATLYNAISREIKKRYTKKITHLPNKNPPFHVTSQNMGIYRYFFRRVFNIRPYCGISSEKPSWLNEFINSTKNPAEYVIYYQINEKQINNEKQITTAQPRLYLRDSAPQSDLLSNMWDVWGVHALSPMIIESTDSPKDIVSLSGLHAEENFRPIISLIEVIDQIANLKPPTHSLTRTPYEMEEITLENLLVIARAMDDDELATEIIYYTIAVYLMAFVEFTEGNNYEISCLDEEKTNILTCAEKLLSEAEKINPDYTRLKLGKTILMATKSLMLQKNYFEEEVKNEACELYKNALENFYRLRENHPNTILHYKSSFNIAHWIYQNYLAMEKLCVDNFFENLEIAHPSRKEQSKKAIILLKEITDIYEKDYYSIPKGFVMKTYELEGLWLSNSNPLSKEDLEYSLKAFEEGERIAKNISNDFAKNTNREVPWNIRVNPLIFQSHIGITHMKFAAVLIEEERKQNTNHAKETEAHIMQAKNYLQKVVDAKTQAIVDLETENCLSEAKAILEKRLETYKSTQITCVKFL